MFTITLAQAKPLYIYIEWLPMKSRFLCFQVLICVGCSRRFYDAPGDADQPMVTVADFPGSNDQEAGQWHTRGLPLAGLLVVVVKMNETNSTEATKVIVEVSSQGPNPSLHRDLLSVNLGIVVTAVAVRYEPRTPELVNGQLDRSEKEVLRS